MISSPAASEPASSSRVNSGRPQSILSILSKKTPRIPDDFGTAKLRGLADSSRCRETSILGSIPVSEGDSYGAFSAILESENAGRTTLTEPESKYEHRSWPIISAPIASRIIVSGSIIIGPIIAVTTIVPTPMIVSIAIVPTTITVPSSARFGRSRQECEHRNSSDQHQQT
jgi:hypothetical protein